jgi:hypothetical protein
VRIVLLAALAGAVFAAGVTALVLRVGDDEPPPQMLAQPTATVSYERYIAEGRSAGERDGERQGRREGERLGHRAGEREGERLGHRAGERVGFERGTAAGLERGELSGAEAALGGFRDWTPGAYYVVTVAPGDGVPFRITTRSPLRAMTNYRLCEQDEGRLCALPVVVASGG